MAPLKFVFHGRIAHHEVGAFGEVRPSAILRTLQEAAIEASTAAGFSAEWYLGAGTQWIVRRTALRIDDALRGGETVAVTTWVADFRRVLSRREYAIAGGDGRPIANGWSDWVYLDVTRGRPKKVEPQMIEAFLPEGAGPPVERVPLEVGDAPADAFRRRQPVLLRDLDGFAHMNNAATVDLLEETLAGALADGGHPLERVLAEGASPRLRALDVEYLDEARHGETLEGRLWGNFRADGRLAASFETAAVARDAVVTQARSEWEGLPPLEKLAGRG
ncbi:MAG: acyl-[acyl-carrier-protein] thioesterase [Candidatus Binatia bacterium]